MLWGPQITDINAVADKNFDVFPFWEMHPSSCFSPQCTSLFLSKIIELAAVDAIHLCPWKKSQNSQLTVVVGFWLCNKCGCACSVAEVSAGNRHAVFLLEYSFQELALVRQFITFHWGYNHSWARIFSKTTLFNYFRDDFVLKMDYNSAKTWQAENPSSRPSRDTFIKHIISLELSVKLKSELRKLHVDFGSGVNWAVL